MKVAVFGAGTMGSGIAQVFAAKGHTALMYASSVASAQRHKDKLAASLQKRVEKGKMTEEAKDAILNNILVEEKSAAADADLVIECVAENMDTKRQLLGELDAMCKESTVFATNTSSLSVTEMGLGLKHAVIGMHFFNPVPSMKLVEVIRGANTTQETFDFIYNLSKEIGKEPVEVAEAPGFVVNKILIPMINEAIGLVETGVASVEDIDKAMMLGANHPMGPLALGDFIGLDVCLAIMNVLYSETGDPKYRPALLLKKMVRGGQLGTFGQTGKDDRGVRSFGGGHGTQELRLVALVAVRGEALDIMDLAAMQDRSVDGTCDLRRAGMTGGIARVGGESADVGYLLPLVQRQCAQIAQEHTALLGQLDSQTAVCGAVRGGRLGRCGQKSAYNVRCSAV